MLEYKGNFTLNVSFGQNNITINQGNLKRLIIIQDINKKCPTVELEFIDGNGVFTHIVPSDKLLSRISIQVGTDLKVKDELYNDYEFVVFSRSLEGDLTVGSEYKLDGVLSTTNLFSPRYSRGMSGLLYTSLMEFGRSLGCTEFEISSKLRYVKTYIQANTSNAEFLDYLKTYLVSKDGDNTFQIFIKRVRGKSVFVCKTLKELYLQQVKYKFMVHKDPIEDYYPAFEYSVVDNYSALGVFGVKKQSYSYFDYFNSTFVESNVDAQDMYSLCDYFMVDSDDTNESVSIDTLGRNTESSEDYSYYAETKLHTKLNSLVKMWILTWGIPNVAPGDLVQVLFSQGQDTGSLNSYQFSGIWMVERVIHTYTGTHRTRLLLTRSGVDSDQGTTLIKATNKKL